MALNSAIALRILPPLPVTWQIYETRLELTRPGSSRVWPLRRPPSDRSCNKFSPWLAPRSLRIDRSFLRCNSRSTTWSHAEVPTPA
eukprot:1386656-Pyramimonas_sp.AAC.1